MKVYHLVVSPSPFLLLWILVICTPSTALLDVTFSCFSFPVASLPTFGFSSSSGLYITGSGSFLSSVADTGTQIDVCFLGLVTYVISNILPNLLNLPSVVEIQKRLQENTAKYNYLDSNYKTNFINQQLSPTSTGTRRLDQDVSNYIDTSGSGVESLDDGYQYNSVDIVEISPPSLDKNMYKGQVTGIKVTPQPGPVPIKVQPIVDYSLQDNPGWSTRLDNYNQETNLYNDPSNPSWSTQEKQLLDNPGWYRGSVSTGPDTNNQDLLDIDYTSGDLVSYHASLS